MEFYDITLQIASFTYKYLQIVCVIYVQEQSAVHKNMCCDMNVIANKISRIQAYFCVNTWELALSPGLD